MANNQYLQQPPFPPQLMDSDPPNADSFTQAGPSQLPPTAPGTKHPGRFGHVLGEILKQFALQAPQSVGNALYARMAPEAFQQEQQNLRQKMQLAQQLQLHQMMTPYEKAQLAQQQKQFEAQQTSHGQAQDQQEWENQQKLFNGMASGVYRQIPQEAVGQPQASVQQSQSPGPDGLPMNQTMINPLAGPPLPTLSAGGVHVQPVPDATLKDQVEIDPSMFAQDSELGKSFAQAGLKSKFRVPAAEAFKLMEQYATNSQKRADATVNQKLLESQVKQGHEDIDARFNDPYYQNLYQGKVDPQRDFQRKSMHAQLDAAFAHDSSLRGGGGTAVTQALSAIRTYQSPWEKAQEKIQERSAQNADILARQATTRADKENQLTAQSWEARNKELNEMEKPITDWAPRFGRLKESLDAHSPVGDALVAPELLTVMAGGMGSGLRMNESEISRIVGGRTKLEDLKAAINKWRLDPAKGLSITEPQRAQMSSLLDTIGKRMRTKVDLLTGARDNLADATSIGQHRRIINGTRKGLLDVDFPENASNPVGVPPAAPSLQQILGGK